MKEGTIIGAVRIRDAFKLTDRSYECAAWWEEREAIPGIYPITLERGHLYPRELRAVVRVAAKVTDDYFPGLWGGNLISREPYKPKHVGEDRIISQSFNVFEAIDRTGNSPGSERDVFISLSAWRVFMTEAETDMRDAYQRLAGYVADYEEGDDEYNSRVRMIGHVGRILADRSKQLDQVRTQVRRLTEESDMWRRYYNANTAWARDFLANRADASTLLTSVVALVSSDFARKTFESV